VCLPNAQHTDDNADTAATHERLYSSLKSLQPCLNPVLIDEVDSGVSLTTVLPTHFYRTKENIPNQW